MKPGLIFLLQGVLFFLVEVMIMPTVCVPLRPVKIYILKSYSAFFLGREHEKALNMVFKGFAGYNTAPQPIDI